MAKNQAKPATEEAEPWIADDTSDFDDDAPAVDAPGTARGRMLARQKIEDLLERRRLHRQLSDYDAFELDDGTLH